MNLPHALATLTRDVLQKWKPEWIVWRSWDYPEWHRPRYIPGGSREDGSPILYMHPDAYRRIERACHEEYQRRVARYVRKLEDMMAPHVWQQLVPIGAPEHGERLRGPRGPDPFSVTLTREELAKLYPPKD